MDTPRPTLADAMRRTQYTDERRPAPSQATGIATQKPIERDDGTILPPYATPPRPVSGTPSHLQEMMHQKVAKANLRQRLLDADEVNYRSSQGPVSLDSHPTDLAPDPFPLVYKNGSPGAEFDLDDNDEIS